MNRITDYNKVNSAVDSFYATDNFGNQYLFVRSGDRFVNIAKCEVVQPRRKRGGLLLITNATTSRTPVLLVY